MNGYDDLSSIDFGSTIKIIFSSSIEMIVFVVVVFRNQEGRKRKLITSNDHDDDRNCDEQRQLIVKTNSRLTESKSR